MDKQQDDFHSLINLNSEEWSVDTFENEQTFEKKETVYEKENIDSDTEKVVIQDKIKKHKGRVGLLIAGIIVILVSIVAFILFDYHLLPFQKTDLPVSEDVYSEEDFYFDDEKVIDNSENKEDIDSAIESTSTQDTEDGVDHYGDLEPDDFKDLTNNKVKIPDVSGLTESQAMIKLSDFDVEIIRIYNEWDPNGYVFCLEQTDPKAGTIIEKNSKLKLYISAGSGDDAWSEWSDKEPSNGDIVYYTYDLENIGNGRGILIDSTEMYRYRDICIDRDTGDIINKGVWHDWDYRLPSSYEEIVENSSYHDIDTELFQLDIECESKTFYRWRKNYNDIREA